jgi:hypothetical protein
MKFVGISSCWILFCLCYGRSVSIYYCFHLTFALSQETLDDIKLSEEDEFEIDEIKDDDVTSNHFFIIFFFFFPLFPKSFFSKSNVLVHKLNC